MIFLSTFDLQVFHRKAWCHFQLHAATSPFPSNQNKQINKHTANMFTAQIKSADMVNIPRN